NKPRFRLPLAEACTPRGVATHLGETLAQTAFRHHAQSREPNRWGNLSLSGGKVQGSRFFVQASKTRSSRRSSSPARSAPCPSLARLVSRQRNSSSATLSAASTAKRCGSPVGADSL